MKYLTTVGTKPTITEVRCSLCMQIITDESKKEWPVRKFCRQIALERIQPRYQGPLSSYLEKGRERTLGTRLERI